MQPTHRTRFNPSTMCIFIHLDPSGSSRWLGNACLSLPLSKLHCTVAPGKCNGHYECHDSSLLHSCARQGHATQVSFPAWLPQCQSSSSSQCLPTVHFTRKCAYHPNQTPSFTFHLGEIKVQSAACQTSPKADPKGYQRTGFHPE